MKNSLTTLFAFLCAVISITASAQKLPNKQEVSIWAPANVKIDGKPTEWGNQLQAYNTATGIFYTLANDDKKLYLIVQCKDQRAMNLIINGGITLAIQKTGKKNDDDALRIKFPYFEKGKGVSVGLSRVSENGSPLPDPKGRLADSLIKANNTILKANVKWIYTSGVLGKDSLVSIDNDSGIEAANEFDGNKNSKIYTSELAIDLNLLGLSAKNISKFSYHIVPNGEPNKYGMAMPSMGNVSGTNKDGSPMNPDDVKEMIKFQMAMSFPTTDFWGEYTLAKKP